MAEKEIQFEKIKRISKIRENIRNICTSAHIHHGKCIAGSSRVLLTDGSIKTAKEIFEDVTKEGRVVEEKEEHAVYSPNKKIKIAESLANEIILASQNSNESFAVKKKTESEKQADSAR